VADNLDNFQGTEIVFQATAAEPETPPPGKAVMFVKDNGDGTFAWSIKFDNGTVVAIAGT